MIKQLIFCSLLFCSLTVQAWALTPSEVVDRVQERYVPADCEALFTQESRLKAMGTIDTASGRVYFKKPNMMRWDYELPEKQSVISNGKNLWIYRPDDAQVMTGRSADYFDAGEGMSFLLDIPAMRSQFEIQFAKTEETGVQDHVLELIPHVRRPSVSKVYLSIDKTTFDITRAKVVNSDKDITVVFFSQVKFGKEHPATFFSFQVPKGVEILQMEKDGPRI
ncbi:MAG: outer membrane lipoprotein carrier protein LolA [Pseudomonadota bacterium]